jgi:hypothetical protein
VKRTTGFFFLCSVLGAVSVLGTIGCGRKGPPLAPIVYLPRPVTELAAKRVENDVVVQFTVPTLNTDGTGPADLRRVEVYAHTGPLPTPADFLKYGTLVASIDIADPAQPTADEQQGAATQPDVESGAKPDTAGTTQPVAKQEPQSLANARGTLTKQGQLISVREALTDRQMEIGPMPPAKPLPPPLPDAPVVETIETPGTVNFELTLVRNYVVFGVSDSRGRRGPHAGPLRVPLVEPLTPPPNVDVSYTESAISLAWPPQPEDVAPAAKPPEATPAPTPVADPPLTQETAGTIELYADLETDDTRDVAPPAPTAATSAKPAGRQAAAAKAAAGAPSPRYGYNVYEVTTNGDSAAARSDADEPRQDKPNVMTTPTAPVLPLNTALLTAPTFSDPRVEFDVERCYSIRRVEMSSGIAIEGRPTAPVCVTPIDTFPPAPPKNVQAISGGTGVSLLWEANSEPDFGGYLVLRAEAPDDKLSPLTPTPISDTSFNDTTVRRGRTYVYEVVAVDRRNPANRSAPSNRVEETIR